jgi:hypothetical protein
MALPGIPPVPPVTAPAALSSSGGLVAERFAQAEVYGGEAWSNAWEILNALKDADYTIVWNIPPWTDVDDGGIGGITPSDPTVPTPAPIIVDAPDFTTPAPVMPEVVISIGDPPPFDVTDPGFEVPPVPSEPFPIFSDEAPPITDPDIPTKPPITLPPVPVLSVITIPSPPEYDLPDFEGTLPVTDLTAPEPMFVWNEAEYSSSIKDQLASKLLLDLINGGSGLNADTEQAIYDRATARQELENNQMYDEALNFFSSRGWRIPPGALGGRLMEAVYKIAQVREDLNNDILIQQSKLAQENTHFIIASAIGQEKNLMDYTNQYQQRAFDAAKYVVESALLIFQIKVEAYKAELEVYKVQAMVFEARIRAEIAKAELYKAQIDGIRASVEIQKVMIDAYVAQVQAVLGLIELYKAEMEGARLQTEVDKTKIQSFGVLVEAYKTRVQAVTERYKAYQAQIAGEVAKAQMYSAQVDGYKSKVDAFKVGADVVIAEVTAQVELNRGKVDSFKAEIEAFKAKVGAAVAQANAEVEIEKLDVAVFEAEISQYEAEVEALTKVFMGRIEEAKAKADLQIKEADLIIKEALAKFGLAEKAVEAASKVAAQLAASGLSIVSASAALGYQESRRDATSNSASMSMSGNASSSVGFYTHIHKEG